MVDFICFKCKSKILTKRLGRYRIEVKCTCPHKKEYNRTYDDDDSIQKFLTEFTLYDPEIDNRGKPWSKSEAKHLEGLWFTNLKYYSETEIKNELSKRFGRSEVEISSQLKIESTGTKYGPDGYDKDGYNKDGYNKDGYNKNGYTKDGYDVEGYHVTGFHRDTGYNRRGFNIHGIFESTKTRYGLDGYDKDGYNEEGYHKDGYNKEGIFKSTRTKYGSDGYNKDGYNRRGFNIHGIFESTRTKYDPDGYNKDGFDCEGYDKNGWNASLRDLPLQELVSSKRSSNFYDLRQRKKELSFNFMNKTTHWVGTYYSKSHYPDQYASDELTQTIIRNKHETNGNTPAQYISKLMHEYLTEKNLGSFDCIIPVANHKQNFEQISGAVSIGQELSKLLKIECLSNALEKTLNIKAREIHESQKREFWNNNDLYIFSGIHNIQDKKILLVDDVITHDYTISQCIYQLGCEGPKDITVLCAGRTMK
jgi:hypothetical protein